MLALRPCNDFSLANTFDHTIMNKGGEVKIVRVLTSIAHKGETWAAKKDCAGLNRREGTDTIKFSIRMVKVDA